MPARELPGAELPEQPALPLSGAAPELEEPAEAPAKGAEGGEALQVEAEEVKDVVPKAGVEPMPAAEPALPHAPAPVAQAPGPAAADDVEMAEAQLPPAVREDVEMRDAERVAESADVRHAQPEAPAPPSPHPTDELHRHSPTTPQEQEHEHDDVRSSSPRPADGDGDEQAMDPRDSLEEQRLKLTGGVVIPLASAAERDAFFSTTWASLDEPHQRLSAALFDVFAARDDRRRDKAIALRREYKALNDDWRAHCARLDQIRDRVHRREQQHQQPLSSLTAPQTPSIDSAGMPFYPEPVTPGPTIGGGGGGGGGLFGGGIISSRANRRSAGGAGLAFGGYGDAVRSEAEFLEILASLETADLRDPDARAARTAAVVPDMVIDASERREVLELALDDERYRVDDPVDTYGIDRPLDVWTEAEVETFCKRYAANPKQFGKIAADLPDKSTAQCVLFYYRMKNTIDFRSLSDRRGRDGRRKKAKKRPEGGKGSSLLSNLNKKPRIAAQAPLPVDERDDEDDGESAPTSPRLGGGGGGGPRREAAGAAVLTPGPSLVRARPRPQPSATVFAQEDNASDDLNASTRPNTASTPKLSSAPASGTPGTTSAQLLPSEGTMEAAEALGALGAFSGAAGGNNDDDAGGGDDPMQTDDLATPKARVRKPRSAALASTAASAAELDAILGTDDTALGTDLGGVGDKAGPGAKPKRRSNTSSYWTVAERNEIVRLLGVHGTDWKKVAEGLGNKTWVQCRNVRRSPSFRLLSFALTWFGRR